MVDQVVGAGTLDEAPARHSEGLPDLVRLELAAGPAAEWLVIARLRALQLAIG